jgi:hypothetical protein
MGPGKTLEMSGTGYVNILRKEGVEIGKMDYLKPYIGDYVDMAAAGF